MFLFLALVRHVMLRYRKNDVSFFLLSNAFLSLFDAEERRTTVKKIKDDAREHGVADYICMYVCITVIL